ncbi:hypothetical protein DFR40_2768 [Azonexus fungiphilus]|jgi:hypothetical protein|uniref:Uncharacterized protein n=1 Tax=Azonexus fungiphilus TaxID=146940 RepID=A0A495VQW3_9RHOO|nr:hypothetical protein [Azonexus fungiphilus]RKT50833.1 hypothetical protein DFR40_2768 [Azonexus fungiphilus]
MKQLQKWFDLIAGISEDEQKRLAMAHAIFGSRGPDLAELAKPACWRRPVHVRSRRG